MQCGKAYWGGWGLSGNHQNTLHPCRVQITVSDNLVPSLDLRVINSLPMVSSCVTQMKWRITLASLICLCVHVDLRII